jgi:F0F1-type ATP synthase assembly protein I
VWPEWGLMREGSLVELEEHQATWQGFSDALARAVEFVAVPMLFALLGDWLDHVFGISPVLAIVLGLIGFVGVVLRTYYWYQADMVREEEGKPWKRSRK